MSKNIAPKHVHPTAIDRHALFGQAFVNQHMLVDDKWTMGALIQEFQGMANLLNKRVQFQTLEEKAQRKYLVKTNRDLRTQCHDGRTKLQQILHGSNVLAIRNYLLNHKDLQRLYQNLPINLVVENINQRTFAMRKERDRLRYRLKKSKEQYELMLMKRDDLNTRIKYQNEFILEEQIKTSDFAKKIRNSNVRLTAIKTIHSTYKKVIQILRHDEIFFEPIMESLMNDIDDQSNFIKHILYLGIPAIGKFKELSQDFRLRQEKTRKSFRKSSLFTSGKMLAKQSPSRTIKTSEHVLNVGKRFVRETRSMMVLKNKLDNIENIIKQIKVATLCSRSREIFPRFKTKVENNFKLVKENDIKIVHTEFLDFKERAAAENSRVLLHSFSEEEEKRLAYIKELQDQIKLEDNIEEETLAYMTQRGALFVIIRYFLWNLSDILKHVDRPDKVLSIKYPNSYLKLPLLKFEMLTMKSVAPELFEMDTQKLLENVMRKLRILLAHYKDLTTRSQDEIKLQSLDELLNEFHTLFWESKVTDEYQEEKEEKKKPTAAEDPFEESKHHQNIPTRRQIKLQSAKIVEELSKIED